MIPRLRRLSATNVRQIATIFRNSSWLSRSLTARPIKVPAMTGTVAMAESVVVSTVRTLNVPKAATRNNEPQNQITATAEIN